MGFPRLWVRWFLTGEPRLTSQNLFRQKSTPIFTSIVAGVVEISKVYANQGALFFLVVIILIVVVLLVQPVRRRSYLLCPELVASPQRIESPVSQRLHAGVPSVEIRHLYIYGQPGEGKPNLTTLTL